jgi:hypothetical protein
VPARHSSPINAATSKPRQKQVQLPAQIGASSPCSNPYEWHSGATASTRSLGSNPMAAHIASLTASSESALRRTILGEPSVPELCNRSPA